MDSIILTLLIIVGVTLLIYQLKNSTSKSTFPFKKREFLMNIPERRFYEQLLNIVPENYVVFPQVVLSSIVAVDTDRKSFWKWQNKINKKTLDFVLFDKKYIKPIAVIEYDGSTHYRKDRVARDEFVDGVLRTANIPILHFRHGKDLMEIVEEFIKTFT